MKKTHTDPRVVVSPKKLELDKELVRTLAEQDLTLVGGGVRADSRRIC